MLTVIRSSQPTDDRTLLPLLLAGLDQWPSCRKQMNRARARAVSSAADFGRRWRDSVGAELIREFVWADGAGPRPVRLCEVSPADVAGRRGGPLNAKGEIPGDGAPVELVERGPTSPSSAASSPASRAAHLFSVRILPFARGLGRSVDTL